MGNGIGSKHQEYPLVRVEILVRTLPGVPDPSTSEILEQLSTQSSNLVTSVSRAKYFQIKLANTTLRKAKANGAKMAKALLANPVIEYFEIHKVEPVSS